MDATPASPLPCTPITSHRRWLALYATGLGVLLSTLDATIVSVALPTIGVDLHLTNASQAWVMDAYMVTLGGFLVLGGRLGDRYGERRIFLAGLIEFSASSLICGLATSNAILITARAAQGIGGAVLETVGLSLVTQLFTDRSARAKAMGIYAFICAAGGALGVVLGGVLTSALNWHWVFLVNVPVGLLVCGLCVAFIPPVVKNNPVTQMDWKGAIAMTLSFLLVTYGIVDVGRIQYSIGAFVAAAVLFVLFIKVELRESNPLIPMYVAKMRTVVLCNVVAALLSIALFCWIYMGAQYLQFSRGLTPRQIGLAFAPSNVAMAISAAGLSANLVLRYGIKRPLIIGLLLTAAGLLLLAQFNSGTPSFDVLPGMLLVGIGAGIAFNPLLLAATSGAPQRDAGLVSGLVSTSLEMGGGFGIAILSSLTAIWAYHLAALGVEPTVALKSGYQVGFLFGAAAAMLAAVMVAALLRPVDASSIEAIRSK